MREAINNEIRFQQFQGFKHLSELWNFVGIEPQGQLKGGQGVTEEPKRNFTQFATMQSSFLKLCPATIRKNYFYSPLPPYKNHWFIWSCTFPSIENAFPRTFPWEFGGQTGQESTAALLEADHCKLGLSHLIPHPPLLHRLPLSVLPSWRLLIGRGQKSNVFYWSADAFERRHHIRRLNSRLWFSLSNTCIDPVKTIFETSGLKLSYSKQKSG